MKERNLQITAYMNRDGGGGGELDDDDDDDDDDSVEWISLPLVLIFILSKTRRHTLVRCEIRDPRDRCLVVRPSFWMRSHDKSHARTLPWDKGHWSASPRHQKKRGWSITWWDIRCEGEIFERHIVLGGTRHAIVHRLLFCQFLDEIAHTQAGMRFLQEGCWLQPSSSPSSSASSSFCVIHDYCMMPGGWLMAQGSDVDCDHVTAAKVTDEMPVWISFFSPSPSECHSQWWLERKWWLGLTRYTG